MNKDMLPVTTADGTDITEGVQILYDIVHSSLDWGSGMLDNEEMTAVLELAGKMGWTPPDIPGNSPAMLSVAREFPDMYEILPRTRLVHSKGCTAGRSVHATKYNPPEYNNCCEGTIATEGLVAKTKAVE